MRKILFFLCFHFPLYHLPAQSMVMVDVGSVLTYDVISGSDTYTFTARILEYNLNGNIVFEYEMSEPANKKGKITLTSAALDSANRYQNYFSGGEEILYDRLAVFLSAKNFNDMVNQNHTDMYMIKGAGGGWDAQYDNFPIMYKNEEVSVNAYYCQLKNGGKEQLVVAQLGPQPVIVQIALDFILRLKSIE